MSTIDDDTLLERSWEYREETLYRRLFGDTGPGIYPLDMDLLRNVFKQEQIDPRWLREADLQLVDVSGMAYEPWRNHARLSSRTDINYLAYAVKPA